MCKYKSILLLVVTVCVYSPPALAQCVEKQKLTAPDAGGPDAFGNAVSISGDTAVVAANGRECDAHPACGAVIVYRLEGDSWVEKQQLTASDPGLFVGFGKSVSVSGDTIVVGAWYDICTPGISCGGVVFVFRNNGEKWIEQQMLAAFDGVEGYSFLESVSVSGNTILVGASRENSSTGAAYMFHFDGATWVEQQKLLPSNAPAYGRFGASVSLAGDTALIGAFHQFITVGDDGAGYCGAVYAFRFNGVSWSEEQQLTAFETVPYRGLDEWFGWSVALSGDMAMVGARWQGCSTGQSCGSVYAFRFNGTRWIGTQKLVDEDEQEYVPFGGSVSMDGDTAVIGAETNFCASGYACGAAFVYRFDGASWIEQIKLVASDANAGDFFGEAVAVHKETAIVGALGLYCEEEASCGTAYVFNIEPGAECDDCDGDGIPDDFEIDCNGNGQADSCDISNGESSDCNDNRAPDECDIAQHESRDCNDNRVPDECEPDGDHDGVPDDCDQCLGSDTSETVVVNSCDSGVANVFLEDGCNMMDRLGECREKAGHHGGYVSCVKKFTRRWRKHDLLSEKEAARIVRCAAQDNKDERRRNMPGRR